MSSPYRRRYLPHGRAVHAVLPGYRIAACGFAAPETEAWLGTGTQDEYERAAALPPCRRCIREIGDRWTEGD